MELFTYGQFLGGPQRNEPLWRCNLAHVQQGFNFLV